MKLGIIIPTYDSLDTLKTLLKNIFDFTDGDYVVYVIEDGQKKETIDYLKTQKVKAIYHKVNKGISPSWNEGLKEAEKDNCTHFAILNDDIELPDNWWKDCRKMFEENDIHLLSLDFFSYRFSGWFFIIDRECIKKVGYFDEEFAPYCVEDDDFLERYYKSRLSRGLTYIKVFHHGSRTLNKLDKEKVKKVKEENKVKFRKKHPKSRYAQF